MGGRRVLVQERGEHLIEEIGVCAVVLPVLGDGHELAIEMLREVLSPAEHGQLRQGVQCVVHVRSEAGALEEVEQ